MGNVRMAGIDLAADSNGYLSHTRSTNSRSRSHIPIWYHTPVRLHPLPHGSRHILQSLSLKSAMSPPSPMPGDKDTTRRKLTIWTCKAIGELCGLCEAVESKEFLRLGNVTPVPNHTKIISP